VTAVLVLVLLLRHLSSGEARKAHDALVEAVQSSIAQGEIRQKIGRELSPGRLVKQHSVASAVAFTVACGLVFSFTNGGF